MGAAAPDQTAERRALLSAGGVCALWPRHAPSEAGTAAADFGAYEVTSAEGRGNTGQVRFLM